MKTTLALIAAIVMPGGLVLLSIGLATVLLARYRARTEAAVVRVPAARF